MVSRGECDRLKLPRRLVCVGFVYSELAQPVNRQTGRPLMLSMSVTNFSRDARTDFKKHARKTQLTRTHFRIIKCDGDDDGMERKAKISPYSLLLSNVESHLFGKSTHKRRGLFSATTPKWIIFAAAERQYHCRRKVCYHYARDSSCIQTIFRVQPLYAQPFSCGS
jgi:hypothetical protein